MEVVTRMTHLNNKITEKQKNIMRDWFFERFEDPAERCPCEEGEYIYIYGGPYYASDEIHSEFDGVFSKKVIKQVIDDLNSECQMWSKIPTKDWYYNEFDFTSPIDNFYAHIIQVQELSNISIKQNLENSFFKLLYVNIITILETYLRDTFLNKLFFGDALKKFIKTNKDILKKNYRLCDIYQHNNFVNDEIKEYISEVLWHNLPKVCEFYKITFEVDFPEFGNLFEAVKTRHDIVHRNGKDKDDVEFQIYKKDVIALLQDVENFVKQLEQNFKEKDKLVLDKLSKDLIDDF